MRQRPDFFFRGVLPASKSILNRLLLIASYAVPGHLIIDGDSACDDVRFMRDGLKALVRRDPIECGASGVVFRFLALKASRLPGRHVLIGYARLFERPHKELIDLLTQLGVKTQISEGHAPVLVIESDGWREPSRPLAIDSSRSSQFASGLLLNAWDLPFELPFCLEGRKVSMPYFHLSETLAIQHGMNFHEDGDCISIEAQQKVRAGHATAESDVSSAFAVAALAAVDGTAEILQFPAKGLQPDALFPTILGSLGIQTHYRDHMLSIRKTNVFKSMSMSLRNHPDLFPVLAVLCAMAEGTSVLGDAPHLVHKESDRLHKIAELIHLMGRSVEIKGDGLIIYGRHGERPSVPVQFNPDQDHRLAIAAGVARQAGFPLQVLHREVVAKSFPEFWDIAEGRR